jgi:hypothetical protein
MRRQSASTFAITALAAMLLAAAPCAFASAPEALIGRLCVGGASSLPSPLQRPDGRRDFPDACHAACTRNARGECEEDGDS